VGLLKYRMRDRLMLNTEARSEYDSATHQAADRHNTLHQVAIEACGRNHIVGEPRIASLIDLLRRHGSALFDLIAQMAVRRYRNESRYICNVQDEW